MEENTSKVLLAGDANLAAAGLMNSSEATGQGTSLFVINLCASMAPIANIGKSLPGFETHRLYQVTRREDGRTRYRLRLGFFTSEADAEAVLNEVRGTYPTAFTACLCDEDRKFARGFLPDSAPAPAAPPKIAVVVDNKPAAQSETVKAAPPKPAPVAKAPATDTVIVKVPAPKSDAAPKAPAAKIEPKTDTVTVKALSSKQEAKSDTVTVKALPPKAAAPAAKAPASEVAKSDTVSVKALTAAPPAAKAAPTPAAAAKPAAPAAKAEPAKPAVVTLNLDLDDGPIAAAPAPRRDIIEAPSKLLADIEFTLDADPAPAPAAKAAAAPANEPFRVNKGVDIPASTITLQNDASVAPGAAKPAAAPPVAEASKMKAAQAAAPAAIKADVVPPIRKVNGPAPDLDSTQTIRALTSDELNDDSQEKWFAIQLAVSDQPVNLDAMPRLDIFEAYRVYSVASAGSGKITHALRLGFFREDTSAEAVSGYLKTFFASPTVVRISIAEQARFKDAPAPKQAAAKPDAKVLDLSHARDRAPKVVPTVTMAVETKKFDPLATGSFKAAGATGTHKALATGTHPALSATGSHPALSTGAHKALKPAAKSATPPTKRSQPLSKSMATGKHKAMERKSLSQQLLDEAREVELSQSAIRKLPKNDSLFSKMFGKRK